MEIKKKEKKEAPPQPEEPKPPEEAFKLRKKSSVPRKETPKKEEEPAAPFAGMKLKKSSQVKRTWDDDKMETVDLKHHESEKLPQEETPEKGTEVIMSEPIPDKDAIDKDKKKKKKKVHNSLLFITDQCGHIRWHHCRSPRGRATQVTMR